MSAVAVARPMLRLALLTVLPAIALFLVVGAAVGGDSATVPAVAGGWTAAAPGPSAGYEQIRWRRSRAVGEPWAGRLVQGVRLPPEGRDYFTWDPVLRRDPNRWWRRYGHDRLIRTLLRVLRAYRVAHPNAARLGIGDLSRPRGGDFGARFGGLGHASHRNGLDVDVYYPRVDRLERQPSRASDVDRALSQDLVDRLVRAGARYVFVAPELGLRGPRRVVQALAHHQDHLHFRLRPRRDGR